jgi:hypothetical protein
MAFPIAHFASNNRLYRMPRLILVIKAHSAKVRFSPLNVIQRVLQVFDPCCLRVAQRQFSGLYPWLLSILSMDVPGGRGPMSERNATKLSRQRGQTVIPRPPYFSHAWWFLFSHRPFIEAQDLNAPVLLLPCVILVELATSLLRHPHDRVLPEIRLPFAVLV